jgi:DNA invertase Pin-like site-specific DNA recombinase
MQTGIQTSVCIHPSTIEKPLSRRLTGEFRAMSSRPSTDEVALCDALEQMHQRWVLGKHPDDSVTHKTWVVYVRKSVDDDRDNVSLTDQEGVVRSWAAKMNYDIHPDIFSDVLSGVLDSGEGPKRRPGLQRAMECLEHPQHCGLVVFRLDRLSRSTFLTLKLLNSIELLRKNFASASEEHLCFGPIFEPEKEMQSRMMLLFHCIMAETERYNARLRTKAACDQRARRGLGQSRYSPYGTRFQVKTAGNVSESHDSAILKATVSQSPLSIVPHEGEVKQMLSLIRFSASQIASDNTWPDGRLLLNHLRSRGIDNDHRTGTKLNHVSNLKKNLISFARYQFSNHGKSLAVLNTTLSERS